MFIPAVHDAGLGLGLTLCSYQQYMVQGELLRQQLLLRYCGASQTFESSCKQSKNKSLSRQDTSASAADCDRGSLQLARAGRTLHDVQVHYTHLLSTAVMSV